MADGRPTRVPALPLQFGDKRLGRRRDIPRLGEHSLEIAGELGIERAVIDNLISEGVLGVEADSCGECLIGDDLIYRSAAAMLPPSTVMTFAVVFSASA